MRNSALSTCRASRRTLDTFRKRGFHVSTAQALTHWEIEKRKAAERARLLNMAAPEREERPNYKEWSHENLIKRVTELEHNLKLKTSHYPVATLQKSYKKVRRDRSFDPSKYSTRLIALKLAYLGKNYNGFEHHAGNATPLPTIEEKLWEALIKARLIFPQGASLHDIGEVNWDGCEYSKCGRTDKGVSAFGQVIGLRVRSNRPLPKRREHDPEEGAEETTGFHNTLPRDGGLEIASPPLKRAFNEQIGYTPSELSINDENYDESLNFDPIADELPYAALLNRLLPPDIRILAWCPSPPLGFSARFSCKERQYKYFFTQPAFAPPPEDPSIPNTNQNTSVKEGWLDIAAMREAASYFVGLHDFRNFCKIDGSKQIENFERNMFFADILEVEDRTEALGFVNQKEFLPAGAEAKEAGFPKVYSFTLHGSAFLWHQVRCMVAILFLVGQGLEKPTIVKELLDIEKNPSRPAYEMASDTPLVLWNCVFPYEDDPHRQDALQWLYVGTEPGQGDKKWGSSGLMEDLWKVWRERKIDEVLAGTLFGAVAKQGGDIEALTTKNWRKVIKSQKVYDGSNKPRLAGLYTPVMKKPVMESAQVINERYAARKGFEGTADMRAQKFKRLNRVAPALDDADE